MKILIVDDQRSARRILLGLLQELEGVEVVEASSLVEARRVLEQQAVEVALIDIRLGADSRNRDGLTLVRELRQKTSTVPIVVTASNEMAEIRAAMRLGAYDYILKDELCEELVLPVVEGLRSRRLLEREVATLRARVAGGVVPGLVGASPQMGLLRERIQKVALSTRPVLVTGQTGTGKELVVAAIHALGPNPTEPLLDLNCGAIPEALVESQLFGHERGAFTSADRRQDGYFTAVKQGTLFLDEIAELPETLQPKLLRVLETGRFRAVGAINEQRFSGRIIAATHADLEARVRSGKFREDLFHRLCVLTVPVPALEERRQDIPELLAHFARQQERPLQFSTEAIEALQARAWPGNVRQLRNFVDRAAVFSEEDTVHVGALAGLLGQSSHEQSPPEGLREVARAALRLLTGNKLEAMEEALIEEAMALSADNKSAAARLLGVHRKSVERRTEQRKHSHETRE
jgi:DNA-binding NtrC family response regulator